MAELRYYSPIIHCPDGLWYIEGDDEGYDSEEEAKEAYLDELEFNEEFQ